MVTWTNNGLGWDVQNPIWGLFGPGTHNYPRKKGELHTSCSCLTPTMYQDWATFCRSAEESENSTSRTRRPQKVDLNAHESWTCPYLPYIPWFSALCTEDWSSNTKTFWTWGEEKGMANPSGWSWQIELAICMLSHFCWKSFETSASTSWPRL